MTLLVITHSALKAVNALLVKMLHIPMHSSYIILKISVSGDVKFCTLLEKKIATLGLKYLNVES